MLLFKLFTTATTTRGEGRLFITFIRFLFAFDLVGADDGAKVVSTSSEALCAYLGY